MLETSGANFLYTLLNAEHQNIHAQLVVENHSAKLQLEPCGIHTHFHEI